MTEVDDGARGVRPQPLTTLSPIRPERLRSLRTRLAVVGYTPFASRPLLELSTIQYARWTIVDSLPDPDGGGTSWRLNWSYLLFEASYDGTQRGYLESFADVIPERLQKLFAVCFGFESNVLDAEGSDQRLIPPRAFERFVRKNALEVCDHHFSAALDDSAATLRQALAIERAERRSDRLRGAALQRVQGEVERMALAPPATRPGFREVVVGPWERRVRRARSVNPLTIVAPLRDKGWEQLASWHLPSLPRTYFARIVRLPSSMQQRLGHLHPDRLERDYVLFSSDHYGALDDYVDALHEQRDAIAPILQACRRPPEPGDPFAFREWVHAHRLEPQYHLAGVPPRPVSEMEELVAARRRIAATVLDGPGSGERAGR